LCDTYKLFVTTTELLLPESEFYSRNFQLFSSPLPTKIATITQISQDLVSAVEELNKLHIIHCDISLSNVTYRQQHHSNHCSEPFTTVLIDFNHSAIMAHSFKFYPKSKIGYYKKSLQWTKEQDYYSVGVLLAQLTCFIMKEFKSKEDMNMEFENMMRDQLDPQLPNRILLEMDALVSHSQELESIHQLVKQLLNGNIIDQINDKHSPCTLQDDKTLTEEDSGSEAQLNQL